MRSTRLLIVSHRAPLTVVREGEGVRVAPSGGGLVSELGPWYQSSGALWVGSPGDTSGCTADQRADLDRQFEARSIVPVHLPGDALEEGYREFATRVLWPLCHYQIDRVPMEASGWEAYRAVNQAFAATVAFNYRPGDTIWIHDYPLMLLPAMLRERLPEARIGFFLHVPFPSSEVFRILPWRSEVLRGLLGADLVAFHTHAYMRHFLSSLLHVDGVETEIDRVRVGRRDVRVGVFPMGIDAPQVAAAAASPAVRDAVRAVRDEAGGRRIVLGVDRLDSTMGILRRLQAIEGLLESDPRLCERIRYVQVVVPSNVLAEAYPRLKAEVEEAVGRVNGRFGTLSAVPVHYVHQAITDDQLVALYSAADVMLVTPLRDGMNLVAKTFVAARVDDDGVLVLSEFAGAAAELDGAVLVNPYDVDAVAGAVRRALDMPAGERRSRMTTLRRRVREHDVHAWARGVLGLMEQARPHARPDASARVPALVQALASARQRPHLRLLLDYDGTLVPFARSPGLAAPDDEVRSLLRALSARPGTRVDIVSGRPRETLEAWLGDLPVALWAEHGFWHRPSRTEPWRGAASLPPDWAAPISAILEQFTATTPGSFIETRSASIAWHYRRATRAFGSRQAHELRMLLGDILSNQPFEVLEGRKVVEIRLRGVSKAAVARSVGDATLAETAIIAVGDDQTDEDLFRALPPSAITVAVGGRSTRARYEVSDHGAVRVALWSLLSAPDEDVLRSGDTVGAT